LRFIQGNIDTNIAGQGALEAAAAGREGALGAGNLFEYKGNKHLYREFARQRRGEAGAYRR
jgi:hypothetical protein